MLSAEGRINGARREENQRQSKQFGCQGGGGRPCRSLQFSWKINYFTPLPPCRRINIAARRIEQIALPLTIPRARLYGVDLNYLFNLQKPLHAKCNIQAHTLLWHGFYTFKCCLIPKNALPPHPLPARANKPESIRKNTDRKNIFNAHQRRRRRKQSLKLPRHILAGGFVS
jgi:hypothetical protein